MAFNSHNSVYAGLEGVISVVEIYVTFAEMYGSLIRKIGVRFADL